MKRNNKKHALVFLWSGAQPSNEIIEAIADVLITRGMCIPELLTAIYKDENGIANDILHTTTLQKHSEKDEIAEAVKNAVVYIGKRFENALTNENLTAFVVELANSVQLAKRDLDFKSIASSGIELLNAIEIISTANAIIPVTLAKKYHFTDEVVKIIKEVYHKIC